MRRLPTGSTRGQKPMPQPGYGYPMPVKQPSNGLGIAGFVTGLVGLVPCWVPWLGVLLARRGHEHRRGDRQPSLRRHRDDPSDHHHGCALLRGLPVQLTPATSCANWPGWPEALT
jgi:hypothetical protein